MKKKDTSYLGGMQTDYDNPKLDHNVEYTITGSYLSKAEVDKIEVHILEKLMEYSDKKINEFIRNANEKADALKLAQIRHMEVVEGYLKTLNKIVGKM